VLLGLTAGQKIGLAIVAGLFIAFALASAFFLPRRDPDFPGERGLRLFVVASVFFFVAMIGAMYVLAREEEEEAHPPEAAETGGQAETEPSPTGGEPTGGEGDPQAGEQVFAAAGCTGCHTLEAAGSSGTVGPNLDQAQPSFQEAVETVTNGRGQMPPFEDRLSEEEIRNVAAFVSESTR
jgi:cytochrome c553